MPLFIDQDHKKTPDDANDIRTIPKNTVWNALLNSSANRFTYFSDVYRLIKDKTLLCYIKKIDPSNDKLKNKKYRELSSEVFHGLV